MLAKKYRLDRRQVGVVYRRARRQNFDGFSLKCLTNRLNYARFAVVVPTKVVKSTVERNRLRRFIYDQLKEIAASSNIDCVLMLHKEVKDQAELGQKIVEAVKALGPAGKIQG